jgi:hypothetical protein
MSKYDIVSMLLKESEDPATSKLRMAYNVAQRNLQMAIKERGPFSQHDSKVMQLASILRGLRNALWKQRMSTTAA